MSHFFFHATLQSGDFFDAPWTRCLTTNFNEFFIVLFTKPKRGHYLQLVSNIAWISFSAAIYCTGGGKSPSVLCFFFKFCHISVSLLRLACGYFSHRDPVGSASAWRTWACGVELEPKIFATEITPVLSGRLISFYLWLTCNMEYWFVGWFFSEPLSNTKRGIDGWMNRSRRAKRKSSRLRTKLSRKMKKSRRRTRNSTTVNGQVYILYTLDTRIHGSFLFTQPLF